MKRLRLSSCLSADRLLRLPFFQRNPRGRQAQGDGGYGGPRRLRLPPTPPEVGYGGRRRLRKEKVK
jgi:hypothetical protein